MGRMSLSEFEHAQRPEIMNSPILLDRDDFMKLLQRIEELELRNDVIIAASFYKEEPYRHEWEVVFCVADPKKLTRIQSKVISIMGEISDDWNWARKTKKEVL